MRIQVTSVFSKYLPLILIGVFVGEVNGLSVSKVFMEETRRLFTFLGVGGAESLSEETILPFLLGSKGVLVSNLQGWGRSLERDAASFRQDYRPSRGKSTT